MKSFGPYLNFNGNTREAMTFYQEALGGTLDLMSFSDAHVPGPPGSENRLMHARLTSGSAVLMASDTMPHHTFTPGNNMHVNIDCESVDEIERIFAAMSDGATITMPLGDQFWGARFGMLIDKFGIHWMFNCELAKS
jgi:PhnB protein